MGNYYPIFVRYNEFSQERLIDGENKIYIGIIAPKTNPHSSQAIKIGEYGVIKRLENFIETSNSLIFQYEMDTQMVLTKRKDEIIIYIKDEQKNNTICKTMEPLCREIFRPIDYGDCSIEYDKIPNFIRPKVSNIKTELGKKLYLEFAKGVINHEPIER